MKQANHICHPFAFLAILLLAGCGSKGPDIAGVTGTITMDGKPLADATVVFVPKSGGRPAAAKTDNQGFYQLNFSAGRKGTIPGPNKIRITTLSDPYEDEDGTHVPGKPETIPMKYNQLSKLEFNVEEDKANVANFDLTSDGKVMDVPQES